MNTSILAELQRWYDAQCDGEWEHHYGITIETLDNPGWKVAINLTGTELENAPLAEVQHNEIGHNYDDNRDWLICRKEGTKFAGAGGPEQLEAILGVFLAWARSLTGTRD